MASRCDSNNRTPYGEIMCQFDNAANQALDDIIAARRTNRMFLPDFPPKEQIVQ